MISPRVLVTFERFKLLGNADGDYDVLLNTPGYRRGSFDSFIEYIFFPPDHPWLLKMLKSHLIKTDDINRLPKDILVELMKAKLNE